MRNIQRLASLLCLVLLSIPVFSQKLVPDSTFTPTINGNVNLVEILSDGKILIAGNFTSVNGVARYRIARLNADGSLDTSFDANWILWIDTWASVEMMKVLPDGKVLIGGVLPYGLVLGPKRVLRINADGSFDNTLPSSPYLPQDSTFQEFRKIEQLPNGKILICGKFNSPNGNPKPNLARYNADGTYDSAFTTTIDNECYDIEVQPDGKYLVSGSYSTVDGSSRTGLTRFNQDGSIDTSFNPAPLASGSPALYRVIELQSDGKILGFQQNGSDQKLVRLNPDGSIQARFNNALYRAWDVATQPNGKVIVGGEHRLVFGQSQDFNRYNTDGTHDPSLDQMNFYGPDSADFPRAVAVAADGKVIAGGNFTSYTINSSGQQISRPYLMQFVPQAIPVRHKYDFDGDGKDDMAVYRPSDRIWYLNRSTAGFSAMQFGLSTDIPVAGDYDSDGKADIAVFRDGIWYWLRSSDSAFAYRGCGQAGDIPQPSNYNAYCLVYRPSAARFYTQAPFQNASPVEFRDMTLLPTDKPVVADYDGDGRDDLAVFRDGNWFFMASNNLQTRHYQFGIAGDIPVIGDFDGDLRSDFAVFRPSNGTWYIQKSAEGFYAVQWGASGDIPVPADYDGDGKTDIAIYRDGVWWELRSSGSYYVEQFGLTGDIPAQLR